MTRELVSELTERVLADKQSYQRKDGYWKRVVEVAAMLECSTATAREVLARVDLKLNRNP